MVNIGSGINLRQRAPMADLIVFGALVLGSLSSHSCFATVDLKGNLSKIISCMNFSFKFAGGSGFIFLKSIYIQGFFQRRLDTSDSFSYYEY